MESLIRREFSKEKQPAWRSSVQGMMLDAECTNQDCEAFNERVIVKLGMTTIDLKYDGDRITCPQCEQCCARGVDDTVLFTACCWKFEGVLADGEKRSAEGRVDDTGSSLLFPHDNVPLPLMWCWLNNLLLPVQVSMKWSGGRRKVRSMSCGSHFVSAQHHLADTRQ